MASAPASISWYDHLTESGAASTAGAAYARGTEHVSDYPMEARYHQQAEEVARAALGTERFGQPYQAGWDCPVDALVDLALGDADTLTAGPGPGTARRASPLSSRERQVAVLVAEGLSTGI